MNINIKIENPELLEEYSEENPEWAQLIVERILQEFFEQNPHMKGRNISIETIINPDFDKEKTE